MLRVRVFEEGTHPGIRGYRTIAYEGIISSPANGYYFDVQTVISQRTKVRRVFVDDISLSTIAADEHDVNPKKRAAVLESQVVAAGDSIDVL